MNEKANASGAPLIGAWQLVSCTMESADGSIDHPFGLQPGGAILYTPDGWMSAHLIDRGGAASDAASSPHYSGYFGPFSLSEVDSIVIHHVRGASDERIVGDQQRRYRIDGDTLILTAAMAGATIEVIWKRAA